MLEPKEWLAAGGLAFTALAAFIGWFVRLERALNSKMSHDHHEKVCDKNQKRLEASLDDIRETLRLQDELREEFRSAMSNQNSLILARLAVLDDRWNRK